MAKSSGRSGRRWEQLKANLRLQRRPCCRCGQPIDYGLKYPDPNSYSVDHHPHPLSTHPHLAEDPRNLDAAHLTCNKSAGNRANKPGIGNVGKQW